VTFDERAGWSLWDIIAMRDELAAMLGRPVDGAEEKAIRNLLRRQHILQSREVVYDSEKIK